MKTYKIYLIRNGITQANEDGLYIGRTDMPISPKGLSNLLEMRKAGEYPNAVRFFTSPLTRCRQTLEVFYPGCKQEIVAGLAECDFGEWDGRSVTELKSDDRFHAWMEGKLSEIPGGESSEAFQQRVTSAFQSIVENLMKNGDTEAVVCTHGGVVMLLMAAFALPRLPIHEWTGPDGGGFALRITPSVWMRQPFAEFAGVLPIQHNP